MPILLNVLYAAIRLNRTTGLRERNKLSILAHEAYLPRVTENRLPGAALRVIAVDFADGVKLAAVYASELAGTAIGVQGVREHREKTRT